MTFENIYKETEENIRLALLSLWTPGNHPMRLAINELFDREPLIAEPIFQSTFGWEPSSDNDWSSYIDNKVFNKIESFRKRRATEANKKFRPFHPFSHQAESWKQLKSGKSIVVTSGTGSGKTECFMYPVISDLCNQENCNAVQAIFLYPLNALMEDQKERLSDLCQATGLTFAVYNGDTKENSEPTNVLQNEVATRLQIRDNNNRGTRPNILLSNPSMLEYILVRKKDQQWLQESSGKLRWIIIDEAHSYSGSAAVELSLQIKRILNAFNVTADEVRFACTSATIGGEEGTQSLTEFIATLTGQSLSQIKIIGGNRLVPSLNEEDLIKELKEKNLPSSSRVLSLRKKINEVPGMSLQQMWEWLNPELGFDRSKLIPALQQLDSLCEMSQNGVPVLSLRAHFFMRAISGIYACANESCPGHNPAEPLYGQLTTYKAAVCPRCGKPLLELLQCKRCNSFILSGESNCQTHKISATNDVYDTKDYFALSNTIDTNEEEDDDEEEEELTYDGNPSSFFLIPYDKEHFFNPISTANYDTLDIKHQEDSSILEVNREHNGKWVEVIKNDGHSYCPSCGKLAEGKNLNFLHFRIPINFINQTIAPVFLKESAQGQNSWGKYIAFTDSRQGTAISAKSFNIGVEKLQCYKNVLEKLANLENNHINILPIEFLNTLTEEQRRMIMQPQSVEISISELANLFFTESIYHHITANERADLSDAYKAALVRNIIGRRPAYQTNIESLGFITLKYPGLGKIERPDCLKEYCERYNCHITDADWRDYLKILLDHFVRQGNHIQPFITNEKDFSRDCNFSSPIADPNDNRTNVVKWPSVKVDHDNSIRRTQSRVITVLCAGLGIDNLEVLSKRREFVNLLLENALQQLVENKILKRVESDGRGYDDTYYRKYGYVGCYYLDLSKENGNNSCRIVKAESAYICPATNKLLDTIFCGYSPLMAGEISQNLFERFKCAQQRIKLPSRPKNNDEVEPWMNNNEEIKNLKNLGLWTDRHKYSYKYTPAYIAAEHSAQQSKALLRDYTNKFKQENPSINVLQCSTTMEMGVDIGDIDIVLMDTIPPTAANYLQRVGRAGRMGQSKSIAFSLCNNTPVGQQAFANPMWALQTTNHMIKVKASQTITQRHINSYFFRKFICINDLEINGYMTIDDFMSSACDNFIQFLNNISTDDTQEDNFHQVFGTDTAYTVDLTIDSISNIQNNYNRVIKELNDAFDHFTDDVNRQMGISNQIRRIKSENLLNYLSVHQFIPNANMPTGVVSLDFIDSHKARELYNHSKEIDRLKGLLSRETNGPQKTDLRQKIFNEYKEIAHIKKSSTASRDIRTALNEYAPEQTIVVNEKNYVSAGVVMFGTYNEETQMRGLYHCVHCGHTEYSELLDEGKICPICNNPYHSIIDRHRFSYTCAYEPVGFKVDQNVAGTREEQTIKHYFDIRPILLNTNWNDKKNINLCEVISSGEQGKILFYNVGKGHGFAFCKRCGRAAIEHEGNITLNNIPEKLRPGHTTLWGSDCPANRNEIARHVIFTGYHPTCYCVMRFKEDISSPNYINDQQLVYSLGVVICRSLAQLIGIDQGEIDFGIKQEQHSRVLFIYDTAKGGCGYSLRLMDPVVCNKVFEHALTSLQEATCECELHDGACTSCLINRNNHRYAHLLSKGKVMNWLKLQKSKNIPVPKNVKDYSPTAKVDYRSFKQILKESVDDPEVNEITICASDSTSDYSVTDWIRKRSEMGRLLSQAIDKGKDVKIRIEYRPENHPLPMDKLPFINLNDKFPDFDISLIQDMGPMKTGLIVHTRNNLRRYFTDEDDCLSFSNNWGENCKYRFVDETDVIFTDETQPSYEILPNEIIREGYSDIQQFQIKNYFSCVIVPTVLKSSDINILQEILEGKHVNITFSDMYVNSALSSLMLVYLIKEIKDQFHLEIDNIMLQLDSPKRRCQNERFNDFTYVSYNFRTKEDADTYTDNLFNKVLGIDPEHALDDATHSRWLRIEVDGGGLVEIRPDHGISGGFQSASQYMNLDNLDGSVIAYQRNENELFYVIMKKANVN